MLLRRMELGYITVMEERAIALRMGWPAPDQEEQDRQAFFHNQREYENARRAGESLQSRRVRRDRELRRREDIYREAEDRRYELARREVNRREDHMEREGRGEGGSHRREGGGRSHRRRQDGCRGREI